MLVLAFITLGTIVAINVALAFADSTPETGYDFDDNKLYDVEDDFAF